MKLSVSLNGLDAILPSRYKFGSIVMFFPNMNLLQSTDDLTRYGIPARIDKINFTESKVTYDLAFMINDGGIDGAPFYYDAITVKDVDSTFVTTISDFNTQMQYRIPAIAGNYDDKFRALCERRNPEDPEAEAHELEAASFASIYENAFVLLDSMRKRTKAVANSNDTAYHGTSINALIDIYKNNEFVLSQVAGKEAEAQFAKRPYFLSVRRGKLNPHHYYSVTIEFDASKLHSKMKRESVNYWGPDAVHTHFEQEDRYYYGKSSLKNVRSMIKAVYIDLTNFHPPKGLRQAIIGMVKDGVKIYAINDKKGYRRLDKRKAVPVSEIPYGSKSIPVFKELTDDERELQTFRGIRAMRDKFSDMKFIVDTLYSKKAPTNADYAYVRDDMGYRQYEGELGRKLKNIIHNASHGTVAERKLTAKLQDYMTKHKLSVEQTATKLRDIIRKTDGKE